MSATVYGASSKEPVIIYETSVSKIAGHDDERAKDSGDYLPLVIAAVAVGAISLITIYTILHHTDGKNKNQKIRKRDK